MDAKIISVIIGVLLGAVISFVSFQYKLRVDRIEKLNTALFRLLEIWTLIGTAKLIRSKSFVEKMAVEIQKSFPEEQIDEVFKDNIRQGMLLVAPLILSLGEEGSESVFDKYSKSIFDLAPIYPVKAFEMNNNQLFIKYLQKVDILLKNETNSEMDRMVLDGFNDFALEDAFKEFERDLKYLARKSGFLNHISVGYKISRVKNRIKNHHEVEMSEYLTKVLGPAVQKHYDNLGIENPNLEKMPSGQSADL